MQTFQFLYKTILIGIVAGSLTACASAVKPLEPGAEQVKLITTAAPHDCQLRGQVQNVDENGRSQSYTSHAHLQMDEMNMLRNQALKLGANVVVITQHQTLYGQHSMPGPHGIFPGAGKIKVLDAHGMIGNAYTCPALVANQIVDTIKVDE